MTVTELDLDFTIFEELERTRPCKPWAIECGKEAQWLAIKTCCLMEFPLCDPHRRMAKREQGWVVRCTTSECYVCGTEHSGVRYYLIWVRL